MDLGKLEQFAVEARQELMRNVSDKIDYALRDESALKRYNPKAVEDLTKAVKSEGKEAVVEKTAYIWFNRFCALRFMDANGYTDSGVVTPPIGGTIPGILSEARDGNFDEACFASGVKERVLNILSGKAREDDPNSAAYRALFIATCNDWSLRMPFLFEKIGDWTEILLPDDLLSSNSILAKVRAALTPEVCADVEVIGWLYQFYISEKKNKIEEGFKHNVKASAENIPAVTQLFTPHWIVKYLVQNSLGRLWMRLHPESRLVDQMEYFVPDDEEHPTPLPSGIERPEDIKVCDPCCGSAHMLIYAFDILYYIYEECGNAPAEIPGLILKYNLFGLELDPRAAALACFALTMKARSRYSRFLRNPVQPNICAIKAVRYEGNELEDYLKKAGVEGMGLMAADLPAAANAKNAEIAKNRKEVFEGCEANNPEKTLRLFADFATFASAAAGKPTTAGSTFFRLLHQFEEADNFGSLVVPEFELAAEIEPIFQAKDFSADFLYNATHQKVLAVLREAAFLSPRYHVVVTNPPYLGGKNMNNRLKAYAEENYEMSKSDLFAMFIERCAKMCVPNGAVAMITMQSWMFLSSFEDLRKWILNEKTILSMAHLGARAFDTIGGEVVSTTAFSFANTHVPNYRGGFARLVDGQSEAEKSKMMLEALA